MDNNIGDSITLRNFSDGRPKRGARRIGNKNKCGGTRTSVSIQKGSTFCGCPLY